MSERTQNLIILAAIILGFIAGMNIVSGWWL
jgi:hypothetical protein